MGDDAPIGQGVAGTRGGLLQSADAERSVGGAADVAGVHEQLVPARHLDPRAART
jgi:hypothetical protein